MSPLASRRRHCAAHKVDDGVEGDVGEQRRNHRPLPRPPLARGHDPVLKDARLEPFLDQAENAVVADPMPQETHEPFVAHRVEERADVGVHDPVRLPCADSDHPGVERVMRAASGAEPIREPEEVLRVRSAFSTSCTALWTILSSRAATARGRCLPSAFAINRRREGSG